MRNPALLIFANALILIVAFAILSQFLFVVQLAAITTHVKGDVSLQHGGHGNFVALSEGSPIRSGDIVRCGERASAELKWPSGGQLKVMPATEISVKKLHRASSQKWHASLFYVKNGQVAVHLDQQPAPEVSLQIQTPTALATAHSTDFVVAVHNGQTQVKVEQGSVEVESHGVGRNSYRLVTAKQSVMSCFPGEVQSTERSYGKLMSDDAVKEAAIDPLAANGTPHRP